MWKKLRSGGDEIAESSPTKARKPAPDGFAQKVLILTWIGSVQGAVATWSVIRMRYLLRILDAHSLTRLLPLPVLTRSKRHSYF